MKAELECLNQAKVTDSASQEGRHSRGFCNIQSTPALQAFGLTLIWMSPESY